MSRTDQQSLLTALGARTMRLPSTGRARDVDCTCTASQQTARSRVGPLAMVGELYWDNGRIISQCFRKRAWAGGGSRETGMLRMAAGIQPGGVGQRHGNGQATRGEATGREAIGDGQGISSGPAWSSGDIQSYQRREPSRSGGAARLWPMVGRIGVLAARAPVCVPRRGDAASDPRGMPPRIHCGRRLPMQGRDDALRADNRISVGYRSATSHGNAAGHTIVIGCPSAAGHLSAVGHPSPFIREQPRSAIALNGCAPAGGSTIAAMREQPRSAIAR